MRIECFISYEKDDRDIAIQIIKKLQSECIEPWWDEKLSLVSDELTDEIKGAILNCQNEVTGQPQFNSSIEQTKT